MSSLHVLRIKMKVHMIVKYYIFCFQKVHVPQLSLFVPHDPLHNIGCFSLCAVLFMRENIFYFVSQLCHKYFRKSFNSLSVHAGLSFSSKVRQDMERLILCLLRMNFVIDMGIKFFLLHF